MSNQDADTILHMVAAPPEPIKTLPEPIKTLNGVELTLGQAMTLRVAMECFSLTLDPGTVDPDIDSADPDIDSAYLARISELRSIIYAEYYDYGC